MRNPRSKGTGAGMRKGMWIRNAHMSLLLFLVLASFVCSSQASRGLRLSMMVAVEPPVAISRQRGAEQLELQNHRRLMTGEEATTTINTTGDFEEISECNLENLHECAPPALGSQFPTFESKKEVPNGPNPLHN